MKVGWQYRQRYFSYKMGDIFIRITVYGMRNYAATFSPTLQQFARNKLIVVSRQLSSIRQILIADTIICGIHRHSERSNC